jgi:signal transduction histidine kinase
MTGVASQDRRVPAKALTKIRRHAALSDLGRLERVFADCEQRDERAFKRGRRRARARAVEVLERGGTDSATGRAALLVATAELFDAMKAELVVSPRDAIRLAARLEEVTGLPRIVLARDLLRSPEHLSMLPAAAIEVQLAMLVAFGQLRSASLWRLDRAEHVTCLGHVGEGEASRGAKQLARQMLAGEMSPNGGRRRLTGLPIGRRQQPVAVLVASSRPGTRESSEPFLAEAAPMLGAVLERDALLAGNAASERALVQSSERKLTRLGFDLHDGPIQGVAALAEDLRLFRDQMLGVLAPGHHDVVRGRFEDLDSQLASLDVELRRISNEVHAASVLLNRPFTEAVRDVARSFATRMHVEPRLRLDGDMTVLSVSQQIALLNIVHEALANVREHSGATDVEVVVSVSEDGVEAQVVDNGCGFDLEATLIRAARRGRLGLVAMHERVRLLGGQCRIDSRPGGPTTVSVVLERWEPLTRGSDSGNGSS